MIRTSSLLIAASLGFRLAKDAARLGIDPTEFIRRAEELRRDAVRAEQRRILRALGKRVRK